MAKNLNQLFPYKKIKPTKYRQIDINQLKKNPIQLKEDWTISCFTSLKRYLRFEHYKIQRRRCAYCRRTLNPLGLNEHLDHVVARSIREKWMFKPRNLILSCYQCNTQKSHKPILDLNKKHKRLPRRSRHYLFYNPYVHNWSDHFELEFDLFFRAKSKIGENTISALKLYDYKYSIAYAEESNSFGASAIMRAVKRISLYDEKSVEFKSAQKLIKEIERHI